MFYNDFERAKNRVMLEQMEVARLQKIEQNEQEVL
jgi:hypothetical protein